MNFKIHESSFMNEDLYECQSLRNIITELSDPKIEVTIKKVINFVVSYFYAYRHPESFDARVPFQDIEYIFNQAHRYFKISRENPGQIIKLTHGDSIEEFEFFQQHGYAVSMLGDIAATSIIVQEIIKTLVDPSIFNGDYIGIDLGSGSGILTGAGIIGATRQRFDSILSIACEINPDVCIQSQKVLQSINTQTYVFPINTTEVEQMREFSDPKGKHKITRIINETITTTGIAMGSPNDPFYQNLLCLYTSLGNIITSSTCFFPNEITMEIKMGAFQKEIQGNKGNKFLLEMLLSFEKEVRSNNTMPKDWNIFQHLYPLGIEVGGITIPMHEIGKTLYNDGGLKKLADWRHRWSDRGIK